MALLISFDVETGAVTLMASPDELKLIQQTSETRAISTYLRVDPPKE